MKHGPRVVCLVRGLDPFPALRCWARLNRVDGDPFLPWAVLDLINPRELPGGGGARRLKPRGNILEAPFGAVRRRRSLRLISDRPRHFKTQSQPGGLCRCCAAASAAAPPDTVNPMVWRHIAGENRSGQRPAPTRTGRPPMSGTPWFGGTLLVRTGRVRDLPLPGLAVTVRFDETLLVEAGRAIAPTEQARYGRLRRIPYYIQNVSLGPRLRGGDGFGLPPLLAKSRGLRAQPHGDIAAAGPGNGRFPSDCRYSVPKGLLERSAWTSVRRPPIP